MTSTERESIICENRAKQLQQLLRYEKKIKSKLNAIAMTSDTRLSIPLLHSFLVQGAFSDDMPKNVAEILGNSKEVDYDTQPKMFLKHLSDFLKLDIQKDTSVMDQTTTINKSAYIQVLQEAGFTRINNDTVLFGKKGQYSALHTLIETRYLDLEQNKFSHIASCNIHVSNEAVLKAHNYDLKAPYNGAKLNRLDEDTSFKVFFKETKLGGILLIKLPLGAKLFPESRTVTYDTIAQTYCKQLIGGAEYLNISTYLNSEDPRLRIVSGGASYEYKVLVLKLVNEMSDFANSDNRNDFMDYIGFCTGQSYNGFEFLTQKDNGLGHTIAIGTKMDGLEQISITGDGGSTGFVGGMLIAGPGSGKTVLYNTMILQALALNNEPYTYAGRKYQNSGNGAIIMLDVKNNEWVGSWRASFKAVGKKLYGFDGAIIPPEMLWYVKKSRKKNSDVYERVQITQPIPLYIGGICFIKAYCDVIRDIYGQVGVTSVTAFNRGNYNVEGITKLPRTLVVADEVNTISDELNGMNLGRFMSNNLYIAKTSRTANVGTMLAGQDLSKSVIGSREENSYSYRIAGTMADTRYDYYGITVPENIRQYEQASKRSVLTQGVFLVGKEIVKSMYLPEDENTQALQQIDQLYGLQGLDDFEQVVKYGIRHGIFTSQSYTGLNDDKKYPGHNILPAALFAGGLITQEEFNMMTSECIHNSIPDSAQLEGEIDSEPIDFTQPTENPEVRQREAEREQAGFRGQNQPGVNIKNTVKSGTKTPVTAGEALFTGKQFKDQDLSTVLRDVKQVQIKPEVGLAINSKLGIRKRFMENSPQYRKIMLSDTWNNILKATADDLGGRNKVYLVEVLGGHLYINKRLINLDNVVSDDIYGISDKVGFTEIIRFEPILTKFPGLTQLTIDPQAYGLMVSEFGKKPFDRVHEIRPELHITILAHDGTRREVTPDVSREIEEFEDKSREVKKRMSKKGRVTSFGEDMRAATQRAMGSGYDYSVGAYKRGSRIGSDKSRAFRRTRRAGWYMAGTVFALTGIAVTTGSLFFKKIFNGLLSE